MHHDYLLLATGMCRMALWAVGAVYAGHRRRPMACAGFSLAALSAIVFSFSNAHWNVPTDLFNTTTYLSPLIPLLIVASFILHGISNTKWKI